LDWRKHELSWQRHACIVARIVHVRCTGELPVLSTATERGFAQVSHHRRLAEQGRAPRSHYRSSKTLRSAGILCCGADLQSAGGGLQVHQASLEGAPAIERPPPEHLHHPHLPNVIATALALALPRDSALLCRSNVCAVRRGDGGPSVVTGLRCAAVGRASGRCRVQVASPPRGQIPYHLSNVRPSAFSTHRAAVDGCIHPATACAAAFNTHLRQACPQADALSVFDQRGAPLLSTQHADPHRSVADPVRACTALSASVDMIQ
jgi:hypothetical protein